MEQAQNTFHEGMNNDLAPHLRKNSTYYLAKNIVLEDNDGDIGGVSYSPGTTEIVGLKTGHELIGTIQSQSDKIVVFTTDNTTSCIGMFDPLAGTIDYAVESTCLNFSTSHPIHGVSRVRNGDETVIYFTDNLNDLRTFNFQDPTAFQDGQGDWDCDKFSLNRNVTYPSVSVDVNDTGGQLEVGAYQVAVRYIDAQQNPTNWSFPTNPVVITDDSLTNDWTYIDGAQNEEYFTAQEGGLPNTLKSLTVTITDTDSNFEFVQLAVIKSVQGLGTTTEVYTVDQKPVSGTVTFQVTGSTGEIDETISIEEVQIDKEIIKKVQTLTQADSSLWLGNVSLKRYDWTGFQRKASKIVVNYAVDQVKADDATAEGNPKNFLPTSAMADEVEALAIVYIMKDGSYSPAFHIPGRKAEGDDRDVISAWNENLRPFVSEATFNSEYAVNETEALTKPHIRKFQVDNTASVIDSTSGKMAYHESLTEVYPNTLGSDGQDIWGEDSTGNSLVGQPIRHHRMPDRQLINLVDVVNGDVYLNRLGYKFSNIEYPSNNVVGHFFCKAVRTEADKTIVDGGIINYTYTDTKASPDYIYWTPGGSLFTLIPDNVVESFSPNDNVLAAFSPKASFDDTLPQFSYFKMEAMYAAPRVNRSDKRFSTPGFFNGRIHIKHNEEDRQGLPTLKYNRDVSNFKVDSSVRLIPGSYQPITQSFSDPIRNLNIVDKALFIHVEGDSPLDWAKIGVSSTEYPDNDDYTQAVPMFYVKLKRIIDPFTNLDNIEYVPISSSPGTEGSTEITFNGGEIAISPFTIEGVLSADENGFLSGADIPTLFHSFLWVESEINTALRNSGSSACNTYYVQGSGEDQKNYFVDRVAVRGSNGDYEIKAGEDFCQTYYSFNKDFAKINDQKRFFPVSDTYEYETSSEDFFPNRIYYSERDAGETEYDRYQVFLANNYGKLDGDGAPITRLYVDKDELYALTTRYLHFVPTRAQEIKTDESIAYIGTGSRLSIPSKKIASPNGAYGGAIDMYSVVNTEFGTLFVDRSTNKIFHATDGLNAISEQGLANFVEENLRDYFNEAFREGTGENYPLRGLYTGTGVISGYDPRSKTVYFTKKDYEPRLPIAIYTDDNSMAPSVLYYNQANNNFRLKTGLGITNVEIGDPGSFTDKSWTVSYNLKHQKWESFHDFTPDWLFSGDNLMYSTKSNTLYSNNTGAYGNYYGTSAPMQVWFTVNDKGPIGKRFTNMSITAQGSFPYFSSYTAATNEGYGTSTRSLTEYTAFADRFNTSRRIKGNQNFLIARNLYEPQESPWDGALFPSAGSISILNTVQNDQFRQEHLEGNYMEVKIERGAGECTLISAITDYQIEKR